MAEAQLRRRRNRWVQILSSALMLLTACDFTREYRVDGRVFSHAQQLQAAEKQRVAVEAYTDGARGAVRLPADTVSMMPYTVDKDLVRVRIRGRDSRTPAGATLVTIAGAAFLAGLFMLIPGSQRRQPGPMSSNYAIVWMPLFTGSMLLAIPGSILLGLRQRLPGALPKSERWRRVVLPAEVEKPLPGTEAPPPVVAPPPANPLPSESPLPP